MVAQCSSGSRYWHGKLAIDTCRSINKGVCDSAIFWASSSAPCNTCVRNSSFTSQLITSKSMPRRGNLTTSACVFMLQLVMLAASNIDGWGNLVASFNFVIFIVAAAKVDRLVRSTILLVSCPWLKKQGIYQRIWENNIYRIYDNRYRKILTYGECGFL